MKKKKIYLVRHGETSWSLSGKHTGRTDVPLTENGKKQAVAVGRRLSPLSFHTALVGPQKRAQDTFALAGLDVKKITDPDLQEWDYGEFEGLTSKEIKERNPNWNLFTEGAPGGESLDDIEKRVESILQKALEQEGDALLFSSGHILRSIAGKWIAGEISFGKHLTLGTGSLSILSYEHDNPSLLLWNGGV